MADEPTKVSRTPYEISRLEALRAASQIHQREVTSTNELDYLACPWHTSFVVQCFSCMANLHRVANERSLDDKMEIQKNTRGARGTEKEMAEDLLRKTQDTSEGGSGQIQGTTQNRTTDPWQEAQDRLGLRLSRPEVAGVQGLGQVDDPTIIIRESTARNHEKLVFPSGATSTKQPRLSLIPHRGLVNAAVRFELGLERHPGSSFNALSNTKPLRDKDWLIERASHCIEHCYKLIDYLYHGKLSVEGPKADAGAIAWAGLVLGEAMCLREEEENAAYTNTGH